MEDIDRIRVVGYELADVLGAGKLDIVYRAVQRSLDRFVAIKLPRRELAHDPTIQARFRREAVASARVDHPNIVHVLDYGETSDGPYLVLELLAAQRLSTLVRDGGPRPIASAAAIVAQLLDGLAELHAAGVIHADVRSDNVLIDDPDDRPRPHLIDFALARVVGANEPTATVASTNPEHLAPEVRGGGAPSFASDLYGAGAILYELVTGSPPRSDAPPPSRVLGCTCPTLDRVTARALAPEPDRRYRDARAFAHDLDEAVRHDPIINIVRCHRNTPLEIPVTPADPRRAEAPPLRRSRDAVDVARAARDESGLVVAYLELVATLVDTHQLPEAIRELETAIETLSLDMLPNDDTWRLQLALAALYSGVGNRPRATRWARMACARATRASSIVGIRRASALMRRLGISTRRRFFAE